MGRIQKRGSGGTVEQVTALMQQSKEQLRIALSHSAITPDRMTRLVITTMRRNESIQRCSPLSIVGSVMQAAQLGLEVDNGLGYAYLVPYKGECTLIVGYKGLIDLVRRSGQLSTIYAVVVRDTDDFSYQLGLNPDIHHVPSLSDEGLVTHVYAVAKLRDGGTQFDIMTTAQVEKIRAISAAGSRGGGPWGAHWEEMAKKTVLRRLCKMLPTSIEVQRVISQEEQRDAGRPVGHKAIQDYSLYLAGPPEGHGEGAGAQPGDGEVGESVRDVAKVGGGEAQEDVERGEDSEW